MKKYDINDTSSYCLGMSLTIEAIKHKAQYVSEVVLSKLVYKNEQLDYLLSLCEENKIDYMYDDEIINKLSLKENCYCIGFFKKYESNLVSNNHIILYRFNDYGELGTVLRSAVSFDYKDIVLIDSSLDIFDPRCIRSSMGSFFHSNIVSYNTFEEYHKAYPKQNIYPFIYKGDKELKNTVFEKPYSIILSQNIHDLDDMYKDTYYVDHQKLDDISLSIRSSIILANAYNQNFKR